MITQLPDGIRQLPSGRFQARCKGPDGAGRTLGTYASLEAAQRAMTAILADISNRTWIDPAKSAVTFKTFAWQVLEYKARTLKPSTVNNHRTILNRWLLPRFGPIPLVQIRPRAIDEWWVSQPVSVNRSRACAVLHHYLKMAVRWEYIKSNPAMVENGFADVSQPRPAFTTADFLAAVKCTEGVATTALVVAFSGHLRASELLGLNADDFSRSTGTLRVSRQYSRGAGLATTKTGRIRKVTLLDQGMEALTLHLEDRANLGGDPMFIDKNGRRLTYRWLSAMWHEATAQAGHEDMRFHDIRHISLTHIAHTGASLREIMARGGHSTVNAALRYQAATSTRDREIAKIASRNW